MDADRKEFELKLELGADEIARLADSPLLAELACGNPVTSRLRSTYFDTPEQALRKAGASLRIRDTGKGRVQTAKLGTRIVAGVSNPFENETPTTRTRPHPDGITDEKLRRKITRIADFTTLKPVIRTEITRTVHRIALPGVEAELSLDTGRIASGRRSVTIGEAELELISGHADAFCDLATRLFGDVPLRFPRLSKAGRGYALMAGTLTTAPAPAKAGTVALAGDEPAVSAFAKVCSSAAAQILGNWDRIGIDPDPEIAHQLRIGLRRLRSALHVFRPAIDSEALRAFRTDLGELGRIVGRLRNCDVMLSDIVRRAAVGPSDRAAAALLAKRIGKRCADERKAVTAELATPRWNAIALRIALLPHGAGWPADTPDGIDVAMIAPMALARCWKKVGRSGRHLERLSEAERHRMRKDLKTLRYALEFFASVLPKGRYERFLRELRLLQDRFGYLNDVVLAQALPSMLASEPDASGDEEMQRLVGFVLGWHSALAGREWDSTRAQWDRLVKRRLPWA